MPSTLDAHRKDPRLPALALFLVAATLAKAPLFAGVTFGDVAFLGACAISARWVMTHSHIARSRWNGLAVLLVMWAMMSGVLAPLMSSLEFSEVEFVRSMMRISVLVAGAILLVTLVSGASRQWVGNVVLVAMTINALMAVGLYAAGWLTSGLTFSIPWIDHLISPPAAGSGILRARGLFAEPSLLGLFQVLGIGYLAFISRDLLSWFDWRKAVVLSSVVLTLSLGALAGLIVIGVGLILMRRRSHWAEAPIEITAVVAGVMALTLVMVVLIQLGTSEVLLDRLTRVVAAQDLSATGRLIGSWDVAFDIAARSPVVGSGLGNLTIAAEGFGYTFETAGRTLDVVPSWNVFAIALASMGIVGLVLYLLLVLELISRNAWAGLMIVVAGFVTGGLLVATLWVFFALYAASYSAVHPDRPTPERGQTDGPHRDQPDAPFPPHPQPGVAVRRN